MRQRGPQSSGRIPVDAPVHAPHGARGAHRARAVAERDGEDVAEGVDEAARDVLARVGVLLHRVRDEGVRELQQCRHAAAHERRGFAHDVEPQQAEGCVKDLELRISERF